MIIAAVIVALLTLSILVAYSYARGWWGMEWKDEP